MAKIDLFSWEERGVRRRLHSNKDKIDCPTETVPVFIFFFFFFLFLDPKIEHRYWAKSKKKAGRNRSPHSRLAHNLPRTLQHGAPGNEVERSFSINTTHCCLGEVQRLQRVGHTLVARSRGQHTGRCGPHFNHFAHLLAMVLDTIRTTAPDTMLLIPPLVS